MVLNYDFTDFLTGCNFLFNNHSLFNHSLHLILNYDFTDFLTDYDDSLFNHSVHLILNYDFTDFLTDYDYDDSLF
jgi:hypothetical protein